MLYHGSKTFIDSYLEPRISYELEKQVYATDDYYYALIRCGKFDISKCLIREDYDDGKRSLAEVYPNAFKEVFDCTGYIYELDNNDFVYNYGTEYIAKKNVEIKNYIKIENVWNEIIKNKEKYELVFYDNSDEYWSTVRGGRKGYLERKQKYIQKVLQARAEI